MDKCEREVHLSKADDEGGWYVFTTNRRMRARVLKMKGLPGVEILWDDGQEVAAILPASCVKVSRPRKRKQLSEAHKQALRESLHRARQARNVVK